MPRGKGTVFVCLCSTCNQVTGHLRILKSKKADFGKFNRYCNSCDSRTEVKIKEEKHSS